MKPRWRACGARSRSWPPTSRSTRPAAARRSANRLRPAAPPTRSPMNGLQFATKSWNESASGEGSYDERAYLFVLAGIEFLQAKLPEAGDSHRRRTGVGLPRFRACDNTDSCARRFSNTGGSGAPKTSAASSSRWSRSECFDAAGGRGRTFTGVYDFAAGVRRDPIGGRA